MYNIDIELFELDVNTGKWEIIRRLISDIENSGSAEVTVPDLSEPMLEDNRQPREPVSAVVIGVGLSSAAPRSTILRKASATWSENIKVRTN